MKILHVVNIDFAIPYFFGGQFHFMKKHGIDVSVACSSSELLEPYGREYDFKPYAIEIHRAIKPLKDLKAIFQLYRVIIKGDFDIVFGHTPKGALIAMCASFLARTKKRIYVRHGLMLETSRGLIRVLLFIIERLTAALSTDVLCVSRSVLLRSEQLRLGEKEKSFMLLHGSTNGVDTNRFSKELYTSEFITSFKKELGIEEHKTIVGFVGRISNDKGIPDLIAAWRSIVLDMPNVHLLMLGVFDDRDKVSKDVVDIISNTPSITHIEFKRDVAPYYAIMKMLILPSYREGMPTVVLEASSMSLPIITTTATGCIDSIIENQTGIFTDHTSRGIRDAIKFYVEHPEIRKQHGENGRVFVVSNFKQKLIWQELLNKVIK